jgi:PPE-repeat protein
MRIVTAAANAVRAALGRRATWAAIATALAAYLGIALTQAQRDALWSLLVGVFGQ